MPYGGSFSAGGFSFFGGNDLAEAVKPKYGGKFSAVGGFSFLAVTTLAGAVKPKYGGNFSAISGFSFFGGNVNGDSKLRGNFGA